MGYMETYKEWIDNPYFDEETKKELHNQSEGSGKRRGDRL